MTRSLFDPPPKTRPYYCRPCKGIALDDPAPPSQEPPDHPVHCATCGCGPLIWPMEITVGARKGRMLILGEPGEETLPSGEIAPRGGFMEWEVPREAPGWWSDERKLAHRRFWRARLARQKEIDESIARNAKTEILYDKPIVDKSKKRVAGPFTIESFDEPEEEIPPTPDDQRGIRLLRRMAGLHRSARPKRFDAAKLAAATASVAAHFAKIDDERLRQWRLVWVVNWEIGLTGKSMGAASGRGGIRALMARLGNELAAEEEARRASTSD